MLLFEVKSAPLFGRGKPVAKPKSIFGDPGQKTHNLNDAWFDRAP